MTCFEVLSWISFLWCLLRDSQFAQTQKLPQGRCHQKKKSKGKDPTQKIYGPSERVFVKAITMPKQRNYYQWMAICAGSSFLVALFHQTHLQTIRSVNRENLIACKCAIEASATPGLYHSSQVSHSWDSLRSSETGISFWAQRNLYIKGHTCSCCCCCCCCFFFCVLVETAKFQLWQFPRTICTS